MANQIEVIEVLEEGPQGPAGLNGIDGAGVPLGGLVGQTLTKSSDADNDTAWESPRQGLGLYVYGDAQYNTVPFNVTGNEVFVKLPNDALDNITAEFPLNGITGLWNTQAQEFDFTLMPPGGKIALRIDLDVVTTSPNQNVRIRFVGGVGSAAPFELSLIDSSYKSIGEHPINRYTPVFILDANSRNFPGHIEVRSDGALGIHKIRFFCDIAKYYEAI